MDATPTMLADLLDPGALAAEVDAGSVRANHHPGLGWTVYNYTEKATYDRAWNPVVLACRGLIVADDGRVIARPWDKFFNHDEGHDLPASAMSGPVRVTDKLDGSLGIICRGDDGQPVVSTRGSLASDQARHATAWLRATHPGWAPPADVTLLAEIIYPGYDACPRCDGPHPGNRVVVDYADRDEMVLLGGRRIATGEDLAPGELAGLWPGAVVDELGHANLAAALAAPGRTGAEGMVVHFLSSGARVKVKQADYVRLHRLVTGLTARRVWEAVGEGVDLDAWTVGIPEEFADFVASTAEDLRLQADRAAAELDALFDSILAELGGTATTVERKAFAQKVAASGHPLRAGLFRLLDGKGIDELVWAHVRPSHETMASAAISLNAARRSQGGSPQAAAPGDPPAGRDIRTQVRTAAAAAVGVGRPR